MDEVSKYVCIELYCKVCMKNCKSVLCMLLVVVEISMVNYHSYINYPSIIIECSRA